MSNKKKFIAIKDLLFVKKLKYNLNKTRETLNKLLNYYLKFQTKC
jgi:hypothetical protein